MQQYNVPQFVEVEDKIIGPLTLRQFFALLAGGVFIILFWLVFQYGILFWILSVPTAGLSLFVAMGNFNGRPVLEHVFPFMAFLSTPKRRLFKREAPGAVVTKAVAAKPEVATQPRDVQSKLKRLSYVLDQKSIAEQELLEDAKKVYQDARSQQNPNQ